MSDFAARRRHMVDNQIRTADVTKFPIINAVLAVPREFYVPTERREAAYMGENLPLGRDRVLLEPRTFAKMLDILNIQPNELVLDLGAGLGYSTAVLARLAETVVAVESDEDLSREAQSNLADQGIYNTVVVTAPLAHGAPEHGPYDAMIVEGAAEAFPQGLADQVKEGGRVACIFMEGALGVVRLGYKIDGQIAWRFSFNASAPVLPGFHKAQEFSL
ncbi:protein-L-isoaspartate O-methyltransferase family protein [Halodurantibacterium flavum]|uniref:Protein-L-isoaspartate O-methyltransferase n=1 Tax=Halodurantibacterium flavum TaxID=1382802 RepID=A0ABW4S6Y4_9RHOB